MITEKEFISVLNSYEDDVDDHMDSDAAYTRAQLMEYYLGDKYGNEREGYSQIITREVYQTVENIKADVAELFIADDETVRFEPEGPEDIEGAKQATDYIRYVFYRQNDGFRNIIDSLTDGVMQRQGVIKRWRDESEIRTHHRFDEISPEAFAVLEADDEVEITEFEEVEDTMTGQTVFSGKLVRTEIKGKTCIEVVPPEEFGYEKGATSVAEALYVRQKTRKTRSQLIAMGFDKAKVDKCTKTDSTDTRYAPERLVRDFDRSIDTNSEVTKQYDLVEAYIRHDRDEDDYDELLKVCRIGNVILDIEEVDEAPFEVWSPIPVSHRLTGLCPADAAAPIQKIKSTLWRNQLDNQYNLNNGRPIVVEGQVDLDSVMNSKPGAPYIVKHPNGISFPNQPVFGQHTYQMMGMCDQMLESDVGATDTSISPDILHGNTAAGAVSQVLSKRQARVRLIAREFGEFLRKVFLGVYELEIAHADDKQVFRLDNRFVEVDPRKWNARKDVTVLVGLGNGNKTEQMFHMQQAVAAQQAMIAGGGLGITVMPQQVVQLQEDIVRLFDKAANGRYFTMPSPEFTGQKTEPDTQEKAVEAQIQIEMQKLQLEAQKLELKKAEFELEVKKHADETEFKIAELNLEARQERGVKIGAA